MTPDDLKRAGVRVRKLHFSQSKVFGYMKRRSSSPPFGEFGSIAIEAMTSAEVDAWDRSEQDRYEDAILSALEPIHE